VHSGAAADSAKAGSPSSDDSSGAACAESHEQADSSDEASTSQAQDGGVVNKLVKAAQRLANKLESAVSRDEREGMQLTATTHQSIGDVRYFARTQPDIASWCVSQAQQTCVHPRAARQPGSALSMRSALLGVCLVTPPSHPLQFKPEEWDVCVRAAAHDPGNPFLSHAFLAALEDSCSVAAPKGWLPQHLALRDAAGALHAAVPLYAKSHSMGEYVFDHSWAHLHEQLGESYYPKLQCCVPFTPVTGVRVLVAPGADAPSVRAAALRAMMQLPAAMRMSSVHITFSTEADWRAAAAVGWLSQMDLQYHWENDGYTMFDDFLAALKQSKRKSIRQERKSVAKQGLRVRRLRGAEITEDVWDRFFEFYMDTSGAASHVPDERRVPPTSCDVVRHRMQTPFSFSDCVPIDACAHPSSPHQSFVIDITKLPCTGTPVRASCRLRR
jgi:Peptidogalycan biosysnthesis/recognition